MTEIFWHSLTAKETAKNLGSNIEKGLEEGEAEQRQKKFGKNKLPEEKPLSKLELLFSQIKSPLIYFLLIAGVVTFFLEDYTDSVVIFGAVFLNIIVGFIQENKASKALSALKKVIKHEAEVLRSGNLKIIDSEETVPGDIIVLNSGDKVPADGRIVESHELKINEMALTGEWIAANKKTEVLEKETPLADRDNMVYMGCVVEDGKGKAIVTATGLETEIGKVASLVRETKEKKTPYQRKLAHFSKVIGIIIVIICITIFIEGMITGGDFVEMFTTSVAVAVAAIPEGLAVAMTVILALGMQRILKKGGLVRRLASAETLGSTSIIATDKTGTLTEGRMKIAELIGDKKLILKIAFLTTEAFIENPDDPKEKWIVRGRPTDRALLEAGIEAGLDSHQEYEKNKIDELPFSAINKFIAALYKEEKKIILYTCGAPEKLLEISNLTDSKKKEKEKELDHLAQKGYRVLAVAWREIKPKENTLPMQEMCKDLIFSGFIALKDPVRKDVKKAVKICKKAGMRTIIVTGDHKLTAKAVAEELGMKISDENILEGKDLDNLSNGDFEKVLEKIHIYARVEPKHKMRIIEAWQEKNQIVAMTGDGINDAPALKKADVGVAVGSGTEVAKETADLILLNDSFSIIVAAVEEGRAIIDNIRKVITYLLSDSFTEVILIGVSLLFGFPLPVSAVQILWVNLIEDGLPDIALAFEPKEKDLMSRKPLNVKSPLLNREMKVLIFIIGIITDFFLFGLFYYLLKYTNYDIFHIRTVVFVGLAIDSLSFVFSCKSLRKNIWHINIFSNKFLVFAWIFGAGTLLAALYLPPLQMLLKTTPLNSFDWKLILLMGLLHIVLIEAVKWYFLVRHYED